MSEYKLHLGDCLEFMRGMAAGSVDAVITDPPYGANKAEWDKEFPTEWYEYAREIGRRVCVITGSAGIRDSVLLVGNDFLDVIAARNLNALTRGPLGFSNWLACVVAGEKPKQIPNCFEFAVRGEMPDHPSPKPIEYMLKLIHKITERSDLVFDPFMGSGTTGVACMQLGRNFIGCEIDPTYYAIAERRISAAAAQGQLFAPETVAEVAKQETLCLA